MHYTYFFLKKHLTQLALICSLSLWAGSTTFLLLRREDEKLLLIGIDENGTRLITRSDDPLLKTEIIHFVKEFISRLYSFNPETFEENLGRASDLMSKALWDKEKDRVLKLSEIVKKEGISSKAKIESISKTRDGKYTAQIQLTEERRAGKHERKLGIEVSLTKVERSEANPYGIEVDSLNED